VQEAVRKTQEFLQNKANNLVFSLDKDSGEMVVRVVDAKTDEVIRQIPSQEMLELARSLEEFQSTHGVFLKSKA
jgi:flagellar protein FlaG